MSLVLFYIFHYLSFVMHANRNCISVYSSSTRFVFVENRRIWFASIHVISHSVVCHFVHWWLLLIRINNCLDTYTIFISFTMILCLVRRPLDCGEVSGAIQIGNLQFTITIYIGDFVAGNPNEPDFAGDHGQGNTHLGRRLFWRGAFNKSGDVYKCAELNKPVPVSWFCRNGSIISSIRLTISYTIQQTVSCSVYHGFSCYFYQPWITFFKIELPDAND